MLNRPKPSALTVLRSALYLVLFVGTVLPYAACVVLWSWLPMPRRYWMVLGWTRFAIASARVVCGIRYEVHGMENLPDGPAIVLCKHQSAWETLWLTTAMPRPLCYVYKRELHYLPFVGWAMATLDMIRIDRARGHDAFEQVVEQGTRRLAQGAWIVIFPEGTRTAVGAAPHYKSGGARLAVRTGTPIVPIAHNSGEFWPRRAFLKMPGTIVVSIGPTIEPGGRSAEEVGRIVETWIEDEMHRIAPHHYGDSSGRAPGAAAKGSRA